MATRLNLYVPFDKATIDKEHRIVWGIASTETPDLQGDIMSYEGSKKAFERWARNCREMHGDKAVGKAVNIHFDPKRRQIHVGVYVSKGAEDTWQKVLDHTLSGFSIGGYPTRATPVQKNGRKHRRIDDYVLEELSLVDSPANPECRITAITKRGSTLVATDVIGHLPVLPTAGDAITLSLEVQTTMAKLAKSKRAKVPSLVAFSKSLKNAKPDVEVIAVPMSAFSKNAAGELVLDPKAPAAAFTKGELDGDGYDNEADDAGGSDEPPAEVDFGEHAENLAKCHGALCKAAGLGDPVEHYKNSIEEEGEPTEEDEKASGDPADSEPGAGYSKSATGKRRRNALRKGNDLVAQVRAMLDAQTAAFDAKLEKITKGVSGAAPRQGDNQPGARIEKSAGDVIETGDTVDTPSLADEYARLIKRRDAIASGAESATPGERNALVQRIAVLEVTGATPAAK